MMCLSNTEISSTSPSTGSLGNARSMPERSTPEPPQNMKQKVDHYIGAGPRHGLAHDEGTSSGHRRDDLQEIKGKGEKVIGGIGWHLKRKLGRGTVP